MFASRLSPLLDLKQVFAAIVALVVRPIETKPFLAYLMLLVIVGGVGLACVKEGKVQPNMMVSNCSYLALHCTKLSF